jgi:hypothetical protein
MPQTIAMQRGSMAGTFNGTTEHLIFQQSGGNATRVIFNALSCWSGSSSGGFFNLMLSVTNSGTSVILPVAIKMSSAAIGSGGMFFLPDTSGIVSGATKMSSEATASAQTIVVASGSNWPAPNDLFITGGGVSQNSSNSNSAFEFCPKNFWIGSGDSVILRAKTTSNISGTIGWSFTTITET